MNLRDLEVKKGEPVLPAWERLKAWARRFELHARPGIRFNQMPEGTWVIVDDNSTTSWNYPFACALNGQSVSVGAGTLNNSVPLLGGVGIDGLDANGNAVTVPALPVKGPPSSSPRCLRAGAWRCTAAWARLAS